MLAGISVVVTSGEASVAGFFGFALYMTFVFFVK